MKTFLFYITKPHFTLIDIALFALGIPFIVIVLAESALYAVMMSAIVGLVAYFATFMLKLWSEQL